MNLFLEKLKLDMKWAIASRTSILLLSLSFILSNILLPLFVYGIYQNYQIPGWSVEQIVFLYGVWIFIFGFFEAFLSGFRWEVVHAIQSGELDYDLVRPVGLLKLRGLSFFPPSIGDIISGVVIMILFNPGGNVFNLLALVVAAILFLESVSIFFVGLAMKWVEVEEGWWILDNLFEVGRWPRKIFPAWLRLATFVFPIILIGYAPATAYMYGMHFEIPAIIAILLFFAAISFLRFSIKTYSSAGG